MTRVAEVLNLAYHGCKESEKPELFQDVRRWLAEMDSSLLDSQAADPRPHGNQHYPYCVRHANSKYDATLACTYNDYPYIAATAMRDRCVEKVEAMADDWVLLWQKDLTGDHADKDVYAKVAREIVVALKAVTLEQQQEKQSNG